jgi:hypothetical protein
MSRDRAAVARMAESAETMEKRRAALADREAQPPLVLVACALLWIGMAADRYLPQPWLNIAMTAIAVTAIAAKIHHWRRQKAARNGR